MDGWTGSNYDSKLSTKDISQKIRAYIKENYPDYKFSIRTDSYNAISIYFLSSKHDIFNHELIEDYASKAQTPPFNEMPKYEYYPYILKDVNENNFNRQIGPYIDHRDLNYLNETDAHALVDIVRYARSFNYDNSDSYTDYFDTRFYLHVEIGKWNKPFQVL